MLNETIFAFLRELKANNNREWFAANKPRYEAIREQVVETVTQLIHAVALFDPEIQHLEASKCLFRIYRDIRFSPDKSPYKTHIGAVLYPPRLGKTSGFYLHIDPEGSFISCGHYMLRPDQLKIMRKGIYDNFDAFSEILNEKEFKQTLGDLCRDDDTLSRVPNGFDKDHPAAEYMKLKHFYIFKDLQAKELFSPDFVNYAASIFKIMQPLNAFLNELLEEE
ncbi:MAG: DUF2461 domain-containing protein [Dysgonamonadaceae bacterium]|jgi:uncharacterized protein (TIGR02453 family)|nr:DUF2461 domain-containing protein [Dysgonamonadaceae bacterium]